MATTTTAEEIVRLEGGGGPGAPLRGAARATWPFARKKPLGAFGGFLVLALLFFATFADARVFGSSEPLLAPHGFKDQFLADRNEAPARDFPFGTDPTGHDMLSQ